MSTSSRTWGELIGYCRERVEQIRQEWLAWQPARGEGRKPPLGKTLQFAGDTVCAIEVEMEHERPLQAMVLARVLFELTTRLALASMEADGFKRLLAYWLKEDEKLAESVLETRLLNEKRSREFQSALARIKSSLAKLQVKPAPRSMNCVLREISKASGAGAGGDFPWDERTYCRYRDLCRASHGNVLNFDYPWTLRKLGKPVVMDVAYATVGLLWTLKRFMKQELSEADVQEMKRLPDEASAIVFS